MEQPGRVGTAASYAMVLVLLVLCTLWGAFLVPFRVEGTLVPVSLAIVVAANTALCFAGGRLLGPTGVVVAGLLWLGLALTLAAKRPEGDLIIVNGWVGIGYLLLGFVSIGLAYGLTPPRQGQRPGASPGDVPDR